MASTYYLYRHIRPDLNQVFYIGIGKESKTYNRSLDKRRNPLWKDVVLKNGGYYINQIVLTDLTEAEAIEKEKEFILLYKRKSDGGTLTNILEFGTGSSKGIMTQENRKKLSERMLKNSFGKGFIWSDEMKLRRSILSKNNKNNLGKTWSEEIRKKMSQAHLGNKSTLGLICINNGIIARFIKKDTVIPEGWNRGRLNSNNSNNK